MKASDTHRLPDQSWGALPMVHYTLGWLEQQRGNAKAALKHFKTAATLPPDYCFPARLEEIAILETAMRVNPRDARAAYYLGNLLYDRRCHEAAIRWWERSARLDPSFSIVWRNLGIGYFNIRKQPAKARSAYDRALRANPQDGRLLYERDQLWKRLGDGPGKRLRELTKRLDLVHQRDDLSVELAALYNQTDQPDKALALVRSRKFQPWEGGEGGALGQWTRANILLGQQALQRVQSLGRKLAARSSLLQKAIEHLQAALTAPHNLGEARHLLANQGDIHYWLGVAFSLANEMKRAIQHWQTAATFKGDFQAMSVRAFSEMTYYSALSLKELGRNNQAQELLLGLLAYAQQLKKSKARLDYFATSLPALLLFDDNLQFRQQTTSLFLQAQAHLGLGRRTRTIALLRTVLKRDPSHALAGDLLRSLQSGRQTA